MDCPIFQAGETPRTGELKPYTCPLVYCAPRSDVHSPGNFTFSICVKSVNEMNSEEYSELEKTCKIDYELCESSCGYLQGESIWYNIKKALPHFNTTQYTAVGCIEGDHTSALNKSSVFPPSSIIQRKHYPDVLIYKGTPPTSSNQLHTSMTIPWILMIALFTVYFMKKL